MDQVSRQVLSFSPFPGSEGELIFFADYEQWEDWFELEKEKQNRLLKKGTEKNSDQKQNKKKLSYKEQLELDNMESTIHKLEAEVAELNKEIEKPENAANSSLLQELSQKLGLKQSELDQLFLRWSELEKKT